MTPGRDRRVLLLLLPIVAVGAGLRLYQLDSGLPDVIYVDAFKFVGAAQHMVQTGRLEPQDFQYPGFYTYLLAGLYRLFGIASTFGAHLAGRIVSALFGTGLIVATYLAGRRLGSVPTALLAAALTALSITCLTYSRIPATDCILAFFMTAGLWMLSRDEMRRRDFVAAGVCLGLAAGTKFTGVYLAPFLLATAVACTLRSRKKSVPWQGLACGLFAALAVLTLTTPWIVPRFGDYWGRILVELKLQEFGQIGRVQLAWGDYLVSGTPTWEQPWLGTSVLANTGPAVLLAAMAGCAVALSYRFGFAPWLHAVYVIVYLAAISHPGHLKAVRFLIPILPSLFILAGWIACLAVARVPQRRRGLAAALVAVLLLAVPAYRSVSHVVVTGRTPTQVRALEWMKENVPADSAVLLSPFFVDNLRGVTARTILLPNIGSRQYRVPGDPRLNTELSPIYGPGLIDRLRSSDVRYFVSNSYFDDAFSPVADNLRWFPRATSAYAAFRERLGHEAEPVYRVRGLEEGRPGPDIRIYRLR